MNRRTGGARVWIVGVVVAVAIVMLGAAVVVRVSGSESAPRAAGATGAIPVEVAPVERGVIERRRLFSGSLHATAGVTVAPKVGGRLVTVTLDIADPVTRGQVVATLDREEHEQLVTQAEADVAVARATLAEAESVAEIDRREFERSTSLREEGLVSDSAFDAVRSRHLSSSAAAEVARARLQRALSELESTKIRLSYTTVRAEWTTGDERRVVSERHAEEGDIVGAGTPILSIVELDPIEAVFFVTESEYALLEPGQPVRVRTDAYPGRAWTGEVARIAPIFREGSRQARVEVRVPNPDMTLKPGMFARADAVLGRADDAVIVPAAALTTRNGRDVVFIVRGDTAELVPVEIGIREGDRVQVSGEGLEGRVVTLGQQLLGDGSRVSIPVHDTGGG